MSFLLRKKGRRADAERRGGKRERVPSLREIFSCRRSSSCGKGEKTLPSFPPKKGKVGNPPKGISLFSRLEKRGEHFNIPLGGKKAFNRCSYFF